MDYLTLSHPIPDGGCSRFDSEMGNMDRYYKTGQPVRRIYESEDFSDPRLREITIVDREVYEIWWQDLGIIVSPSRSPMGVHLICIPDAEGVDFREMTPVEIRMIADLFNDVF